MGFSLFEYTALAFCFHYFKYVVGTFVVIIFLVGLYLTVVMLIKRHRLPQKLNDNNIS